MKEVRDVKKDYNKIVKEHSPKNTLFKNCIRAFWVGGTLCTLGEAMINTFMMLGFSKGDANASTTILLILLSAILTACNVYDKIGNYAGAGSIIPITGFANAIVSSAMEFKKEGYIYGMSVKMFSVAGPVIVFGIIGSVAVGIVYYIF